MQKILIVSGKGKTLEYAMLINNLLINKVSVKSLQIDDNDMETILRLNEIILFQGYTAIIGIGGGKVLDVCKYVSYISRIDFVSIPTSIAHDGIASPIAVVKVGNQVKSLGCSIPKLILVDMDIIMDSPITTRKAGIGDILSNYTAIYDWQLAHNHGKAEIDDFAMMLSNMAYTSVINYDNRDLENPEFMKVLAQAVIISGLAMEISGDSRPCSGSEHLFSHALDYLKIDTGMPHGIQVALGSVMAAFIQGQDYKRQMKFLNEFKLPYKPSMCGLNEDLLIKAWMNARFTRVGRYTILDIVDSDNAEFFRDVIKLINNVELEKC